MAVRNRKKTLHYAHAISCIGGTAAMPWSQNFLASSADCGHETHSRLSCEKCDHSS